MSKSKASDAAMELAVQTILNGLGLDIHEEGLIDTPRRFVKYLKEFRRPFILSEVLGNGFSSRGHHNMVVQSGIPFRMVCEHHLLPAIGTAAIGYVPGDKVVGLSKLARLVQVVGTERPGLQEYICDRIADLLAGYIKPAGVITVIKAEHTCMACRGIATPDVLTTTSSLRGIFRDVPQARAEFFSLIAMEGRH